MIKFDPTIALHLFCVITFSHRPIFLNQNENKKTKQHKRNILPKLLFCTSQLYLY